MSSILNAPALEAQSSMNQDIFSQLYQSLTPIMDTPFQESSSVFDEWLKQDFLSSECSVNSSPEIATPLDQFLMSPPFQAKDEVNFNKPSCSFMDADLDVSAILDSPAPQLFHVATPSVATTCLQVPGTPSIQMTSLFADIGDSLPAAPTTTTVEMSPAIASASTPTFSTKTKKRANDEEPADDDAAVKRQKNTDAARRSRLRKVQKMETLEVRVNELEKINASLLMRVAVLDSEKTNLKAKESSYESRIKVLEEQLAEAHKALSSRS